MIALLSLAAGAVVSLYAAEIVSTFPFAWSIFSTEFTFWRVSWPAVFFWLGSLGLFFLVYGRQYVLDREAREGVELTREGVKLTSEAIDELALQLKSLPPEGFRESWLRLYVQCIANQEALSVEPSLEDVQSAARDLLYMVALLARDLHGVGDDTVIAANVMVFHEKGSLSVGQRDHVATAAKFVGEREIAWPMMEGLLWLHPELSATVGGEPGDPNPELRPMALLLPVATKTAKPVGLSKERLWRVLPGAPYAFVSGQPEFVASPEDLVAWCKDNADFRSEVVEEIFDYFVGEPRHHSRSFCSLPIARGERKVGVVNVHSSDDGLFVVQEMGIWFSHMAAPFVDALFELVAKHPHCIPVLAVAKPADDAKEHAGYDEN